MKRAPLLPHEIPPACYIAEGEDRPARKGWGSVFGLVVLTGVMAALIAGTTLISR